MDTWTALEAQLDADRAASQQWARELLARTDWLILDTETTGLDDDAEIVQLGLLAPDGQVVVEQLVRPHDVIPREATALHGITAAMVVGAPRLCELIEGLCELVGTALVVSYNAAFDARMVRQSLGRCRLPAPAWTWDCAMERYAAYVGDWSEWHRSYRWQRLPIADGVTGHTAIGDCRSVLALINELGRTEL